MTLVSKKKLIEAINPGVNIPTRVNRQINFKLHNSGSAAVGEAVGATSSTGADETILKPIQAAPEFKKSAYQHLKDISSDFILPGIDKVQDNTISLVETNPEFIQSYMVGLNHEMSRELLWREFPTDQRGTYFSKFWDATNYNPNFVTDRKDIKPIHSWNNNVPLGDATHDPNTVKGDNVVLLIRGELLRKFPNIIIYAQKAGARPTSNEARIFADPEEIKWSIFEATVDPDVYFFGFDLTSEEVIGDENLAIPDYGYYFVLRERPGEIQFGSDISDVSTLETGTINETNDGNISDWDDMSWIDIPLQNGFIKTANFGSDTIGIQHVSGAGNNDNNEENAVELNTKTNSGQMAYALYQSPALVAIHASKMLNS